MPADTGQERTEQATPKRLKEAKKKGQVPRSKELTTLVMLLTGSMSLFFWGGGIIDSLSSVMSRSFTPTREQIHSHTFIIKTFGQTLIDMLSALFPVFLLLVAAALLSPIALGGWSFVAPSFKFEKLDPIKGLGKIFAWRGIVELLKALIKFVLVMSVGIMLISSMIGEIRGLSTEAMLPALKHSVSLLTYTFMILSCVVILIAAVDVPFQLWDHSRQMKMTMQEVKDEFKETEGRPEVKGKIRAMQKEMAQKRMMEDIPQATVIVTNPTHYAIALKYIEGMNAPKVVATGKDNIAAQIRKIGEENKIPLISAPPLARVLFHTTEYDQEIPEGLYTAVAKIITYIMEIENGYANPPSESDLIIPPELMEKDPEYNS